MLIITDYIKNDGKTSVSNAIQKVIDNNPNRTIYFPDGTYVLSEPIITPANPQKSVDLQLANYAVLKADSDFPAKQFMVILGGKDPANDTLTPGSNYSLTGGIIDGQGVANGVEIAGGRETRVTNVSMKNVHLGLQIDHGANSGSSDADIRDLSINGTGEMGDLGINIMGYDNTLTNIRIGKVDIGVKISSSANSLKNVHPLYYSDFMRFEDTVGFLDEAGMNWFDFCYSDQFATAFVTKSNVPSHFTNCFGYWWTVKGTVQTAFRADGAFNSIVDSLTARFKNGATATVLSAEHGGTGVLRDPVFAFTTGEKESYTKYLQGQAHPYD